MVRGALLVAALACLAAGCRQADDRALASSIAWREVPPCAIHDVRAVRSGAVPKKIKDVPPDLAGLSVAGVHGLEIVELRVDQEGLVSDVCLLRGVREDIDARALAAVRQWRFAPVRAERARNLAPGTMVPIIFTVTVRIGNPF
jgi:TonB family protein